MSKPKEERTSLQPLFFRVLGKNRLVVYLRFIQPYADVLSGLAIRSAVAVFVRCGNNACVFSLDLITERGTQANTPRSVGQPEISARTTTQEASCRRPGLPNHGNPFRHHCACSFHIYLTVSRSAARGPNECYRIALRPVRHLSIYFTPSLNTGFLTTARQYTQ